MNKIYKAPIVKKHSILSHILLKKILPLLLLLAGIGMQSNAQVTVNPGGATYTTLKAAFDAINAGTHTGALTINLAGAWTEPVMAILNSSGTGAASYSSILIKPTATATITAPLPTAIVKLNGADFVTIDGAVSGTTPALTFLNNSGGSFSAGIWVASASTTNGATNNTIKNCIITGQSSTSTFAAIAASSGTNIQNAAEAANSDNNYLNNTVSLSFNGIVAIGVSTNDLRTNISDNAISSIGFRGIDVGNQATLTISGNKITGVNSLSSGFGNSNSGIHVQGSIASGSIFNNAISNITKLGVWGCNGIQLDATTTNSSLTIHDNFIWDVTAGGFNGTGIDDNGFGIAVNTGGGYNIYYNSVALTTDQPVATGTTAALWISELITTAGTLNIRNNIFANLQSTSTRYAVYCKAAVTVLANINYNDYFSNGSVGFLGGAQATLANWKAVTNAVPLGKDLNSVSVNPLFTSTTDLHLTGASLLNALATSIAGLTNDIDGDPRAPQPDIGADQFPANACSSNTAGTITSSSYDICGGSGSVTLSATGFASGEGIAYQWQSSPNNTTYTDITGEISALNGNPGTLLGTTWFRLRVTCSAGSPNYSAPIQVLVTNPQATSPVPATRCGTGTVNLGATGSNLKWYAAATGGTPLGTGSPFTTPVINVTTPFWVSASVVSANATGGKPSTNGTDGTNTVGGIFFTANQSFTLNSVVMYPTGAGSNTVVLYAGSTTTGTPLKTATINFAGAAPGGQTVLLGWDIAPGNYTIYQPTSAAQCWRDAFPSGASPATSYPYNIGTACTLTNGSLNGFYYFFYNWDITPVCEGSRISVNANVTAAPTISATPASGTSVCQGALVSLNVTSGNAGYSYTWTPGNLSGAAQSVTPATTTTYTVLADDGVCATTANVLINVNRVPTALVITPASAIICTGSSQVISTTGGTLAGVSVLTENFNGAAPGWVTTNLSTGGAIAAAAWTLHPNNYVYNGTTFSSNDASQFYMSNSDAQGAGTTTSTTLESPAFSLAGFTSADLSFWHFFRSFNASTAFVDVWNGTSWVLNVQSYVPQQGAANNFANATVNLNAFVGLPVVKVRFRYEALFGWFWAVDNVSISGTGQVNITWSPTTGLSPTTGGTVTATPAPGTYAYVATATATGGCNVTATSNISVISAIDVAASLNLTAAMCTGFPATFTVTNGNFPLPVSYQFLDNSTPIFTSPVQANTGTYTYSYAAVAGHVVQVKLLVNGAGGCYTNNPATSAGITVVYTPVPTVVITGPTTVCNGTTTTLTADVSASPSPVSSYQWYKGGVLIPGATLATLALTSGADAGSYTVLVTSTAGCIKLSAAYVVTFPAYNILSSAGPNGSITPLGTVPVSCGNNQLFTITANASYSIVSVTVDGVPLVGPFTSPYPYTFTNVTAAGHTIDATFGITGCVGGPTSDVGPDIEICENSNLTLATTGLVTNSPTAVWSSTGNGVFSPSNAYGTATTYIPSAADIIDGSVTITLTTTGAVTSPCVVSSSSLLLTIKPRPAATISGYLGLCNANPTLLTANTTGAGTYQWRNITTSTNLGTASTQSITGPGTYSMIVSYNNGCANGDTVTIVNSIPWSVTISGNPVFCTRTSTDLSAVPTGGNGAIIAYQWKFNGTNISGANSLTYSASVAGVYQAVIMNSYGCKDSSAASPYFTVAADATPLNGTYTIGVGPASCTNYESFFFAIKDLNSRSVSGDVTFNIPAGYLETVPPGGLVLGSATLNAALATGKSVGFRKSGAGANPLLTAYVGTKTPGDNIPDGIFMLRGTDNVSIDQIDLTDPNTTEPATMEYGYGLFKFGADDGARGNTIKNCKITLNRLSTVAGAGLMPDGSTGILMIGAKDSAAITASTPTAATGANSNNKFYSNNIQNCNNGIVLSGYAAPSNILGDGNNDVGGASSATGNSIINYGGGGTLASAGVRARNQWGVNLSNNVINNNTGPGVNHTATLRGVWGESGAGANATISSNIISVNGGGTTATVTAIDNAIGGTPSLNTVTISSNVITGSYSTITTGAWAGINNTANPATLAITGNTIQNVNYGGGVSFFTGISNSGVATTVNITGNTLQNCTVTGTGALIGISNSSATAVPTLAINGNTIKNITKTISGAGQVVSFINTGLATSATVNTNIITDNTITGSGNTTSLQVFCIAPGTVTNITVDGNFIQRNTLTAVPVLSVLAGYGSAVAATNVSNQETLTNNTITGLLISGATTANNLYGIYAGKTGATTVTRTISGNIIDSLYSASNVNALISGISNGVTSGSTAIYKNKIHTLIPGVSTGTTAFAKGISSAAISASIYDNMINLDLGLAFSTSSGTVLPGTDALKGIEITAASGTTNLYYNTIRLAGTGITNFGSTAVGVTSATPPTMEMKNNILDNRCGAVGTGLAVALRRNGAVSAAYASTSNNNNFYANGVVANHFLYHDGTTGYQTMASFIAGASISPRESNSISMAPAYLSIANPINLHLTPSGNCELDGGGTPIPSVTTDDYDALAVRDASAPDIGADEFDGSGGSPIWKGVNNDWTDPKNWCGSVPTAATNVVIPAGKSVYPLITQTTPVCNAIDIKAGASVIIQSAGVLGISGAITNAGTFNVVDGTIDLRGSGQSIPASVFVTNDIKNLTISGGSATLAGTLNLYGKLSILGTNRTFATGGFLTLKSNAAGTASVGDLTVSGTGNTITGDVTVERYVYAKKAWRFLSVPTQNNLQTIKQSWQENQPTGGTGPSGGGFGIQITSDLGTATGFDLLSGLPALKTYVPATNLWAGVPATTTPFTTGTGYMVFVRGDRTVTSTAQAANTTVLRDKGALVTGTYPSVTPISVTANKFAAIGNPYASAVEFSLLTKTNLQDVFYIWDPKLGTYGAYQTFTGPGYSAVPGGGSYATAHHAIESGQAFFVHATVSAGTVSFTESSKVDGSFSVQRPVGMEKQLRANMYAVNAGSIDLFDGVLSQFDETYSNSIDDMDALKLGNFGENLGILRNDQTLSVERRAEVLDADTIFYKLGQLKVQEYQFEFSPDHMAEPGLAAWLEDSYLQSRTPISLSDTTRVNFNIVNIPGSYAPDRFRIVFKLTRPPVKFASIHANRQDNDVMVDWKIDYEFNIHHYDVEKSLDGTHFNKTADQVAKGNATPSTLYNWLDTNPWNGDNFYRIRSVGVNGEIMYSDIVKVNMGKLPSAITVYPNPVQEDGVVSVNIRNKPAGMYKLVLVNNAGQQVMSKTINHTGGNNVYPIGLGKGNSHGNYLLTVTDDSNVKSVFKIVY